MKPILAPSSIDRLQIVSRPSTPQRADGAAGVLDRIAGAARRADLADQAQDQVLGRHAGRHLALEGRRARSWGGAAPASASPAHAPARSSRCRRPARPCRRACRCGCRRRRCRQPGRLKPSSGPITCTMPWPGSSMSKRRMPALPRLGAQRLEQLRADLGRAGAAARAGDGVVGRGEREVRAVHLDAAALQIEQPARAAEVVQQMPVDVQQVGVVAEVGDHVRVPDLGEQRACRHGERPVPMSLVLPTAENGMRLVNVAASRACRRDPASR